MPNEPPRENADRRDWERTAGRDLPWDALTLQMREEERALTRSIIAGQAAYLDRGRCSGSLGDRPAARRPSGGRHRRHRTVHGRGRVPRLQSRHCARRSLPRRAQPVWPPVRAALALAGCATSRNREGLLQRGLTRLLVAPRVDRSARRHHRPRTRSRGVPRSEHAERSPRCHSRSKRRSKNEPPPCPPPRLRRRSGSSHRHPRTQRSGLLLGGRRDPCHALCLRL
jgi:hypothetical protein